MRRNRRIVWISFFASVFIFVCGSYIHRQPQVTGLVVISSNSSVDAEKPCETQTDSSQTGADSCCWLLCVVVGLASGSAGGLTLTIVVCIAWKCKLQNTIMSFILSAKKKHSKEKKAELQEQLDTCVADLTPLMELKSGLWSQREEFRLELDETEEEMEENRQKVRLVEREISESEREKATDKTEGYLRVTERKRRVETHMVLINMQLDEEETSDDRVHLIRE